MSFFENLKVDYKSGCLENYSGRKTTLENQYWYQEINVETIASKKLNKNIDIGIIGYVCEEGVQRNQGRIGTKNGPKAIRNQLGKVATHFKNKNIIDFGNIICVDNYLEDCHEAFSKSIAKIIQNKTLPIAIGGGHDIAYANFNGIKKALQQTAKRKIGIVNFDAHFDLRPVETVSNSGTPFNQILSENKNVDYFAIGIQQQANTKELFEIAKKLNVKYVTNFESETFSKDLKKKLSQFIEKVDYLYITIDLDGFSSAYAPGVSAPSPLGFSSQFAFAVLSFLLECKKVISVDIAEMNPEYDIDNTTARLAARLVDFIVCNS
ncbi:formimidoylglutamase [Polaribacter aquimarinus]|uniref:Formimidoylglutamase n=1 Tax=Polaribacter aquimarinus TaxID=2100726 RepID=A0A2U2J729_9FLAO|nr:formimidoylglutamase [Polaribacter aquimarinus]PWG04127.1 formimidoylglutamase [Polaribacter aquimarinus]